MQTPKIDLVVTRHPSLVALLIERGTINAETPVLEHAKPADVAGKHVLGILPHHLSSAAATITEVPMRLTLEDRQAMQGGDLPIERLREIAGEPVTYSVSAGWDYAEHLPVTTEPHPNGRDEIIIGGDRTPTGRYYLSPFDLRHDIAFCTTDAHYFRDGGSWLVHGTMRVDAFAWTTKRKVKRSQDPNANERAEYERRCAQAGIEPMPWHKAIDVPCAVVMAVEWVDVPGGEGPDVLIQQVEPLVLFPGGLRYRYRAARRSGDPRREGLALLPESSKVPRCPSESDLIPAAQRWLATQ